MSEADLIALLAEVRENSIAVLTNIVTLHLAMVVGIYYFVHKAPMGIRVGTFIAYTAAFVIFVYLLVVEGMVTEATREAILRMQQDGQPISMLSERFLGSIDTIGPGAAVFIMLMFLLAWSGMGYLTFFYRFDDEPGSPAQAHKSEGEEPDEESGRPDQP